jgi:CO/xanthine dehydrogenase FAD-binding subunit
LTGVASAPLRLVAAERRLLGSRLEPPDVTDAAGLAARVARPMDNTDFSFLWRKEVATHFVAAALADLTSPV